MKVKELIKELGKFDEDMEVFHEYDGTFSVGRIEGVYVEENYCYKDSIQEVVILN